MRKLIAAAFLLASAFTTLQAQTQAAPTDTYKVDFHIREDGKVRRYTLLMDSSGNGTFRVGAKVPYATSLSPGGVPINFSYIDIGVNINARVRSATSGKVGFYAEVELSSAQTPDKAANPIVSSVRTSVNTFLTLRKPALVASVEDAATTRRFDVEVTVTPVE